MEKIFNVYKSKYNWRPLVLYLFHSFNNFNDESIHYVQVKICYIDYGNYQDCAVSQLRSLPDKYLYYLLKVS